MIQDSPARRMPGDHLVLGDPDRGHPRSPRAILIRTGPCRDGRRWRRSQLPPRPASDGGRHRAPAPDRYSPCRGRGVLPQRLRRHRLALGLHRLPCQRRRHRPHSSSRHPKGRPGRGPRRRRGRTSLLTCATDPRSPPRASRRPLIPCKPQPSPIPQTKAHGAGPGPHNCR